MKKRKRLGLLLALILCLSMISTTAFADSDAWDDYTQEEFSVGDGTEANPYQIANTAQFYYFTQHCENKYYVLTNDIDLEGREFPIISEFAGVLDGNGHKIINLNITSSTSEYAAMIATCRGTVKNLSVYGTVASTSLYTAAIAGKLSGGTIENCQNYCTVNSSYSGAYVGGLAGYVSEKGEILDCANYGRIGGSYAGGIAGNIIYESLENVDDTPSITGCLNTASVLGHCAGGICGRQTGTTIRECVSTGTITGGECAGGIVGRAYARNCEVIWNEDDDDETTVYEQNSTFIHDCYNTGEILTKGIEGCGGIVGSFTRCHGTHYESHGHPDPQDTCMGLKNCYNVGKVTRQDPKGYSGDILGYLSYGQVVYYMPAPEGCLYLSGINPDVNSKISEFTKNNGGAECSESQLKDQNFYTGYNFNSVWTWDNTRAYPYAILQRVDLPVNRCDHEYELTENTATCTEAGTATYTCTKCGDSYTVPAAATGHSFTTKASSSKATDATCTAAATYYVRCDNCEVVSDSKTVPVGDANGHSFTTKASSSKATDATCTAAATYYVRCDNCEVVSDSKTVPVGDANGHTPAAAVEENRVEATCTAAGSYDEVVYCSVCKAEISRTQKTIEKLPHDFGNNIEYCANGCGTKNPNYVPPYNPPHKPSVKPNPTPSKPETPENPFVDVKKDDYYYDAVIWAVGKGIAKGVTDTTFQPNASCTRAEMVTFLYRAAGSPEPTNKVNPFTDVAEDSYYYKAVLWAVEKGIAKGTSETTFSPNDTCTRGQTVAFLYRYANSPAVSGSNSFADVSETAYYYNATLWAVSGKVTEGTSATTFSPNDLCTRGQIVTFLYRYMGK